MKKVFRVFNMVRLPNGDYSWRSSDETSDNFVNEFDTEKEAISFMKGSKNYVVLPFYKKSDKFSISNFFRKIINNIKCVSFLNL